MREDLVGALLDAGHVFIPGQALVSLTSRLYDRVQAMYLSHVPLRVHEILEENSQKSKCRLHIWQDVSTINIISLVDFSKWG